jgi:hypothetical protein
MRRRVFQVCTVLPPGEALDRLAQLLNRWGVLVSREDGVVRSINTPLPLGTMDPRLYSNGIYWVAINPFSLITAVDVSATVSGTETVISVSINRLRAVSQAIAAILFVIVLDMIVDAPFGAKIVMTVMVLGLSTLLTRLAYMLPLEEIERQLRS